MNLRVIDGDLLDQDVEVIVNAWNRNLIPWWLLILQGTSGAIKRKAGKKPFRELRSLGMIPLGGAVETRDISKTAGRTLMVVIPTSVRDLRSRRLISQAVPEQLGAPHQNPVKAIRFAPSADLAEDRI